VGFSAFLDQDAVVLAENYVPVPTEAPMDATVDFQTPLQKTGHPGRLLRIQRTLTKKQHAICGRTTYL